MTTDGSGAFARNPSPPSPPSPPSSPSPPFRLVDTLPTRLLAAIALFAGLVGLFYLAGTHVFPGNSDTATIILEGQAIAHGNVLLHGWVVVLDPYWLSDALLSALGVTILGVRPQLENLEPAFVVALFTGLAMLAAAESGVTRRAKLAGAATVFVLIALADPTFQFILLRGAWHVSTAVLALGAFWLMRSARFDWRWSLGVGLLAVACLSDLEIVGYGLVPLACAGGVAMLRRRSWRAGSAPIAGAAVALIAYFACRSAVVALGGFGTVRPNPLSPLHQVVGNVRSLMHYGAEMLGFLPGDKAAWSAAPDAAARALVWVHLIGGLVVVAACIGALVRMVRGAVAGAAAGSVLESSDGDGAGIPLDELLLFALSGSLISFLWQSASGSLADARYLTPAMLFASVIAGRSAARYWPRLTRNRWRLPAAIGAAALAVASAAVVVDELAGPAQPSIAQPLATFLEAHHLHQGLGDYWASSVTTLESSGAVVVRPVSAGKVGYIHRIGAQTDTGWYGGSQFEFLVTRNPSWDYVTIAAALRTFGTPAHLYEVGIYHVLVWRHPITVPSTMERARLLEAADRRGG